MGFLILALFVISPFVSLIPAVFGLLKDEKYNKIYSFIISFIFAIIAYYYVPNSTEDLFYHLHTIDVIKYGGNISFDLTEPFTLAIKYFVSIFDNAHFLPFFVGCISYYIIFYLASQFTKKHNVLIKFCVYFFTVSTFNFLTVVSNLFCTLALLIFCYGLYREFYIHKKGIMNYIIYLSAVLIHNSMVFPISILCLYNLTKDKKYFHKIFKICIFILTIPFLITILSRFQSISFINSICDFYNFYFLNNSDFNEMHTVNTIIIYLLKMLPFVISFILKKQKNNIDLASFTFFICILVLLPQTTFAIRYIPIVVMLGIPTVCDALSNKKTRTVSLLIFISLLFLAVMFFIYQFIKTDVNQVKITYDIIADNIVTIWNRE